MDDKKMRKNIYGSGWERHIRACLRTVQCGNYYENLTTLELLKSSRITKCNLICRNYCILLKISKELSRKIL
ncbi:hypothetical protein LEP1GSC088_2348 [Leptospira interrogans str. L1207]|nr:hypothetical protein LEP1GSC088_2348 [Leptospira interrogans str. L1207]